MNNPRCNPNLYTYLFYWVPSFEKEIPHFSKPPQATVCRNSG
jgi:hypothetical protein